MSSLFGSMASAAANAMEGAAIGRAIGNANDRAAHAENQAELWYDHAKKAEATANDIWYKLQAMKKSKTDVETQLESVQAELDRVRKIARNFSLQQDEIKQWAQENFEYKTKVELRLSQVEKALHQSSAEKAALATMLEAYINLVNKLGANDVLPPDLQVRAANVFADFMGGDKLVDEKHIQDIIDKAPMPQMTIRSIFWLKSF